MNYIHSFNKKTNKYSKNREGSRPTILKKPTRLPKCLSHLQGGILEFRPFFGFGRVWISKNKNLMLNMSTRIATGLELVNSWKQNLSLVRIFFVQAWFFVQFCFPLNRIKISHNYYGKKTLYFFSFQNSEGCLVLLAMGSFYLVYGNQFHFFIVQQCPSVCFYFSNLLGKWSSNLLNTI